MVLRFRHSLKSWKRIETRILPTKNFQGDDGNSSPPDLRFRLGRSMERRESIWRGSRRSFGWNFLDNEIDNLEQVHYRSNRNVLFNCSFEVLITMSRWRSKFSQRIFFHLKAVFPSRCRIFIQDHREKYLFPETSQCEYGSIDEHVLQYLDGEMMIGYKQRIIDSPTAGNIRDRLWQSMEWRPNNLEGEGTATFRCYLDCWSLIQQKPSGRMSPSNVEGCLQKCDEYVFTTAPSLATDSWGRNRCLRESPSIKIGHAWSWGSIASAMRLVENDANISMVWMIERARAMFVRHRWEQSTRSISIRCWFSLAVSRTPVNGLLERDDPKQICRVIWPRPPSSIHPVKILCHNRTKIDQGKC